MSSYGENPRRAFVGLVIVVVLFGAFFAMTGPFHDPGHNNLPKRIVFGLVYSSQVTLLRRLEPPPSDLIQHVLVAIETLVGPLQGALLAVAVRRRFQR